jgi:hypothetical protein
MKFYRRLLIAFAVLSFAQGPAFAASLSFRPAELSAHAPAPSHAPLSDVLKLVGLGIGALGITIRKDVGSIAQKFVTRAQAAQGDYKDGVQGAGQKWEQGAQAGESNYEQGVTAAIADKRFGRGVTGQGAKFQANAVNLGSQRYAPGVANAKDSYAKGMQQVISTLQGLNLPPAGPRGSQQNYQRAQAVGTALAAMRTAK